MAYTKQVWRDLETGGTPITAERLNHIEDGIEENSNNWDSISQQKIYCGTVTRSANNQASVLVFTPAQFTEIVGRNFDETKDFISFYNASSDDVPERLLAPMKNTAGNIYAPFEKSITRSNIKIGYMIVATN